MITHVIFDNIMWYTLVGCKDFYNPDNE